MTLFWIWDRAWVSMGSYPLKLSQEFAWIQKAKELFGSAGAFWEKGSGDDAAVWASQGRHTWVWSQDALVQDIHFKLCGLSSLRDLGFKALTVNLSDLAAMGAGPKGALVSLALPRQTSFAQFKACCEGLAEASKQYHCPVVGGDLVASPKHWMISVSILGETWGPVLARDGARPGDLLWVSGNLGEAALGLALLAKPDKKLPGRRFFEKKQSRPQPRLDFAQALSKKWPLTSLMDLSDGLFQGLQQLGQASGVGFEVDLAALKPRRDYLRLCQSLKLDPWQVILSGGEDYELLWTIQAQESKAFAHWLQQKSLPFYCLGRAHRDLDLKIFLEKKPFRKKLKLFEHF